MTTKHTPGPWRVLHAGDGLTRIVTVDEPDGWPIQVAMPYHVSRGLDNHLDANAQVEANAALLAAAPELAQALTNLIAANQRARTVEDQWIQSNHNEAIGMDLEDAQATVIIREREASDILKKAGIW